MSLIAWYPLNGDLKDYSGNNNNLNYINNSNKLTINDSGKIGKCYERIAKENGPDCFRSNKKIYLPGDFNFANNSFFIGYTAIAGENAPFDGMIQDVRIYNRALNDKEISILYNIICRSNTLTIDQVGNVFIPGEIKEVIV